MNLTDIVLVTENDKGTETNMLMTVDDYKRFVDIKDLSDLSEQMLLLGRTLGEGKIKPDSCEGVGVKSCVLCLCMNIYCR